MKLKMISLGMTIIFLLVGGMMIQGTIAQTNDINDIERESVDFTSEMFVDLIGTVNFTEDPTGNIYEGKTESVGLTNQNLNVGSISFAISIGAYHVVYYKMVDGSIPTTVEDLYSPDVRTYTLYNAWENNGIPAKNGLFLSQAESGGDNLVVDTLQPDSTEEIYPFGEMITNTSGAHLDTVDVTEEVLDETYKQYESDVIEWDKSSELYDEFEEEDEPVVETYGTDNMTQTVYTWLARYIEAESPGIDTNTVSIQDNSENVTSESVTVQYDQGMYDELQNIIEEELIEAGVDADEFAFSLRGVGSKIRKKVSKSNSFSFAKGFATSTLKKAGSTVKSAAKTAGSVGSRCIRSVVKSGIAGKVASAALAGPRFVSKATSKVTGFMTKAAGKIAKGPFSFLGGAIEKLKKVGGFILKYWWLWLTILGAGFILFATPVGPFLLNNTIRRTVRK